MAWDVRKCRREVQGVMRLEQMWESTFSLSLGDGIAEDDSRAGQGIARGGHGGALDYQLLGSRLCTDLTGLDRAT